MKLNLNHQMSGTLEQLAALLHRNPYLFSVLLGEQLKIARAKMKKPGTKVYGNIKYFTMVAQSICLEHHVHGLENESLFQKKRLLKFLVIVMGGIFMFLGFSLLTEAVLDNLHSSENLVNKI